MSFSMYYVTCIYQKFATLFDLTPFSLFSCIIFKIEMFLSVFQSHQLTGRAQWSLNDWRCLQRRLINFHASLEQRPTRYVQKSRKKYVVWCAPCLLKSKFSLFWLIGLRLLWNPPPSDAMNTNANGQASSADIFYTHLTMQRVTNGVRYC